MALDRDDAYDFARRAVEALETIAKAAAVIVREDEQRQAHRAELEAEETSPASTSDSSAASTTEASPAPIDGSK